MPSWNANLHCPNATTVAGETPQTDQPTNRLSHAIRIAVKQAIQKKEIVWHAFAFNAEPELMDESLLSFGINGLAGEKVVYQILQPLTRCIQVLYQRNTDFPLLRQFHNAMCPE